MDRPTWLQWRHEGIGSSDAPVIHNSSEWKTCLQLWEEKIQPKPPAEKTNWAMDRGNELEPKMRKYFSAKYSIEEGEAEFKPMNVAMADLPFMKASLDGFAIVNNKRIGIECKFQGKLPHANVSNEKLPVRGGRIPEKYWIQMQHQILIANLDEHFFVSTNDDKFDSLAVLPDMEFQKQHIKECANFWKLVQSKKSPEYCDADFKSISSLQAKSLATDYLNLKSLIAKMEEMLDEKKTELLKFADHPRMRCGDLKIMKVTRAGSVDYSKIPELKGVELDQYRKKPTEYWSIS